VCSFPLIFLPVKAKAKERKMQFPFLEIEKQSSFSLMMLFPFFVPLCSSLRCLQIFNQDEFIAAFAVNLLGLSQCILRLI
jgi:hypothetical protein